MIYYLVILHFIADFIFQSSEVSKRKSENTKWLLKHSLINFSVFTFNLVPFGLAFAFKFALLNAIIHGLVDKFIWKLYLFSVTKRKPRHLFGNRHNFNTKKSFMYWEDSWFYATIGIDQAIHFLTLILLLNLFL